jgi:aminopeptidase N
MARFFVTFLIPLVFIAALASACQPAVVGEVGIGDPYYPELGNGGYDVQRYDISLDYEPATGLLTGTVTIEARPLSPLAALNLDLQELQVERVSVDDAPAIFTHQGHELNITPRRPLRREAAFVVAIDYHGVPRPTSSAAMQMKVGWFRGESGAVNVLSEPDGASTWFPANNHPADKALYRFEISVPQAWVVAAPGELRETAAIGNRVRYVWEMDQPMASYLASINIDHYQVDRQTSPGGVAMRNYLPVSIDAALLANLERLPEMVDYFSDLFGPYPFDAYGVLLADASIDACSNPKALEVQSLSVHCPHETTLSESVLAHEVAHQWFGDSVSLSRWQDIWLKEGMGRYAEWLWVEHDEGPAEFEWQVRANYPQQSWSSDLLGSPTPNNLYGFTIYDRGALAFHALRVRLGDEVFFRLLRTYLQRFQYGNASAADFIALAEEVSGQELEEFFDPWLNQKKIPPIPEMGLKP